MLYQMNLSENLFLILTVSYGIRAIASDYSKFLPIICELIPDSFYPNKSPKKRFILYCVRRYRSILHVLYIGANGLNNIKNQSKYMSLSKEILNIAENNLMDFFQEEEE